ncbi:hypothetical protein CEV33_3280 [Brucella grignonensis]|uniref:Uncharacterized protein n=1 Tax=Brucella grignonensis TaxID=94627 RepID=A0A256F0I3_9HYPH|nr:hypothetical protein CEV33_3280 [Brucella grignonensis]
MRVPVELNSDVDDEAPMGNDITPYDEQHYVTYLRLLNAKAEGADWREVARSSFIAIRLLTKHGRVDAGKATSHALNSFHT